MTPEGRIQKVIELYEEVLDRSDIPADRILAQELKKSRYIGSQDRRYISEMVYDLLRKQPYLIKFLNKHPVHARQLVLIYLLKIRFYALDDLQRLFTGKEFGPAELTLVEKEFIKEVRQTSIADDLTYTPEWLAPYFQEAFPDSWQEQLKSLSHEASVDLRVNLLKCTRHSLLEVLEKAGIEAIATPYSPWGIRLLQRKPLQSLKEFQSGWFDIQDEGSQILSLLTQVEPGMSVLDFCAGAGGKTLSLAMMMQNCGKIIACDIHEWRLKNARERLRRAGVSNVEFRLLDEKNDGWLKRQKNRFDCVVVDSPCSGTGTWRRNPDLKNRLTPLDLKELVSLQQKILSQVIPTLAPKGKLCYMTCSLLKPENQDQVAWLLQEYPFLKIVDLKERWEKSGETLLPGIHETLQLTPFEHQTDGFFLSILEKNKQESN